MDPKPHSKQILSSADWHWSQTGYSDRIVRARILAQTQLDSSALDLLCIALSTWTPLLTLNMLCSLPTRWNLHVDINDELNVLQSYALLPVISLQVLYISQSCSCMIVLATCDWTIIELWWHWICQADNLWLIHIAKPISNLCTHCAGVHMSRNALSKFLPLSPRAKTSGSDSSVLSRIQELLMEKDELQAINISLKTGIENMSRVWQHS